MSALVPILYACWPPSVPSYSKLLQRDNVRQASYPTQRVKQSVEEPDYKERTDVLPRRRTRGDIQEGCISTGAQGFSMGLSTRRPQYWCVTRADKIEEGALASARPRLWHEFAGYSKLFGIEGSASNSLFLLFLSFFNPALLTLVPTETPNQPRPPPPPSAPSPHNSPSGPPPTPASGAGTQYLTVNTNFTDQHAHAIPCKQPTQL
ncbi:MAG: hypothetical protein Q9184_005584 [Pyrenodesmia sp. 2 TL-2023]